MGDSKQITINKPATIDVASFQKEVELTFTTETPTLFINIQMEYCNKNNENVLAWDKPLMDVINLKEQKIKFKDISFKNIDRIILTAIIKKELSESEKQEANKFGMLVFYKQP